MDTAINLLPPTGLLFCLLLIAQRPISPVDLASCCRPCYYSIQIFAVACCRPRRPHQKLADPTLGVEKQQFSSHPFASQSVLGTPLRAQDPEITLSGCDEGCCLQFATKKNNNKRPLVACQVPSTAQPQETKRMQQGVMICAAHLQRACRKTSEQPSRLGYFPPFQNL